MKKEEFASKLRFNAYQCFLLFFVAKTENSEVGVIASHSVGFYIFIY